MVTLTRRIDRNWFDGRIGNRKGIFPVSYVDVICEPGMTRSELRDNLMAYQLIYDLSFEQ